jgi:predicted regulator of Ras-like GTPase activity (Roadblock/LC7/MglB family)
LPSSPRLTNVVLLSEEVEQARARLTRLVEEASLDAALLLLRSGEVAVSHAERSLAQADTLGALLAANFASAREIARILGETGFDSQFQQGTNRHVMTHAVGDGWLLSAVFAQQSQLGLVKVLAARAAEELRPLYDAARQRAVSEPAAGAPPGFRAAATNAIDQLFQERG